jgi:hypothetical protein
MKLQKFMSLPLLALVLIAEPTLSQSSAHSQRLANFTSLALGPLHLDWHATVANSLPPLSDAVALGLANVKAYKFASTDLPGADSPIAFDENFTTVVGTTQLGNPRGFWRLPRPEHRNLRLTGR